MGAFAAAAWLAVDTAQTIQRVGLFGERPPLTVFQNSLRISLGVAALGLTRVRRDRLERIMLFTCAAAASSTALYGFGVRSPSLSAFRLLSHVVMYVLITIVAGRMIARTGAPMRSRL